MSYQACIKACNQLITNPITRKALRNEDAYFELRDEVDKLTAIDKVEPDWKKMIELGSTILSTQTKDVQVLAYVSVALIKVHDAQGLNAAAEILLWHWQEAKASLEPPLNKAAVHIGALEWLKTQLTKALEYMALGLLSEDFLKDCLAHWKALLEVWQSTYAKDLPNFRDIIKPLEDRIAALKVNAENEIRQQEAERQKAAPKPEAVRPDFDLDTNVDDLKNEPTNIEIYQQHRAQLWQYLRGANEDTWLAAQQIMPGEFSNALLALHQGEYNQAVQLLEALFGKAPLWLDLQYYLVKALGHIENSEAAMAFVAAQTWQLVCAYPVVLHLNSESFGPLCSADTQRWLLEDVGKIYENYYECPVAAGWVDRVHERSTLDDFRALMAKQASRASRTTLQIYLGCERVKDKEMDVAFELLCGLEDYAQVQLTLGKKVAKAYYGAYLECLKGKAVEGDRRAIDQKIEKITCTLCEHGVSLLVE
jgi:hypothetical protein